MLSFYCFACLIFAYYLNKQPSGGHYCILANTHGLLFVNITVNYKKVRLMMVNRHVKEYNMIMIGKFLSYILKT